MDNKHITLFEFENMDKINGYIHANYNKVFTHHQLKYLLSSENVYFVLSGINRLQSTLICELGFSYVQQSQRYVSVDSGNINFTKNTPDPLKEEAYTLINSALNLYHEMTKLKDPNKKGRPSADDFVNGISYEDARCVLPLCVTTNVVTSMSADKLIELFELFNQYPIVFSDLKEELLSLLPNEVGYYINRISMVETIKDTDNSDGFFKENIHNLSLDNDVIFLSGTDNVKNIAIGALASQNACSPDEKYYDWKNGDLDVEVKSRSLINNVVGYGHMGILEQGRNTFAMQCSLSTYHQVIRHRLQSIRREPLIDILKDISRKFILPESIRKNNKYRTKVKKLLDMFRAFYDKFITTYDSQFLMQFLLNGTVVKFTVSSNIRNDIFIFRERLCYTAQEEIRKMYIKKFDILFSKYPDLVKYGLPPCVLSGKCKEGKMTCGRIQEARINYKKYN